MKKQLTSKVISVVILSTSFQSYGLDLSQISAGDGYVQYTAASGNKETCFIPRHLPGAVYDKDDTKSELKLCRMSSAPTAEREVRLSAQLTRPLTLEEIKPSELILACPKLNSTNPGVLFIDMNTKELKGVTVAQAQEKYCPSDSSALKKLELDEVSVEAKFKQTVSCSDTSAALASYHLSRLLGGINKTPVSVVRTMDKSAHLEISKSAAQILNGSGDTIERTWRTVLGLHNGDPSSSAVQQVFSSDMKVIFGALSENVKREYKYTPLQRFSSYETRYSDFKNNIGWKRVSSTQEIQDLAGASAGDFLKLVPVVVQTKDVSDMILLDVLMNQQDRIGNIHFKLAWYIQTPEGFERKKLEKDRIPGFDELREIEKLLAKSDRKKLPNTVSEEELNAVAKELGPKLFGAGKTVALVREMILKDNDCGVTKSNMMRKEDYLEGVRKMSPETYSRFIAFAKKIKQGSGDEYNQIKEYFQKDLLYSERSFDGLKTSSLTFSFKENVEYAYDVLTRACKDGSLKLDLDLKGQLTGQLPQVSCE